MLIGYLPKEKVLIEADVYTPGPPNAPAGPVVKENVNLYDNIQRLKLDVQQITPLHGRLVTIAICGRRSGRIRPHFPQEGAEFSPEFLISTRLAASCSAGVPPAIFSTLGGCPGL